MILLVKLLILVKCRFYQFRRTSVEIENLYMIENQIHIVVILHAFAKLNTDFCESLIVNVNLYVTERISFSFFGFSTNTHTQNLVDYLCYVIYLSSIHFFCLSSFYASVYSIVLSGVFHFFFRYVRNLHPFLEQTKRNRIYSTDANSFNRHKHRHR